MDVFFDTTILVAASERSHPHHGQAWLALRRVTAGKDRGLISAHSVVEVYAALTRLPVHPRIHPVEAARILTENILPHFEIVTITKQDYLEALSMVASAGWSGGKIYDALLLRCAAKSEAERIYTFNLAEFRQLAPAILQKKICAPA
jgi:predicted nucleic acid-binding protein